MITNEYSASVPTPMGDLQTDLPGIPRGSSLHEILAGYGLTPSEAPDGLRRYRRECFAVTRAPLRNSGSYRAAMLTRSAFGRCGRASCRPRTLSDRA